MADPTDHELLTNFARTGAERAFATLVQRHVNLVWSAARRFTNDDSLAEEITQAVFIILAQKAGRISAKTILTGWLYQTARLTAANALKENRRRQQREHQAYMEATLTPDETNEAWQQLAPVLDEAMHALRTADRDAVLLRFFENKSLADVGAALGVTEDAARVRVNRALDKLRALLAKQGIKFGATAIATAVAANAVSAAPVTLAATITTAVLTGTSLTLATIAMTTLQKIAVTAALTITIGGGLFAAKQAHDAQNAVRTLQAQQAPLAEQLHQLQAERDRATNQIAGLKEELAKNEKNNSELLKLRGQTTQTQTALHELAKLQKSAAQQSGAMPAYFTNAMAQGITMSEKFKKKAAIAKLQRMKDKLHLTDDQAQSISNIMAKDIELNSQQVLNAMLGKQTPVDEQNYSNSLLNEDATIKALLTPDQLANYPDFKQAENISTAKNSAQAEVTKMMDEMDLSQEQQDKAHAALYQLDLNQASSSLNQEAIAKARVSGNLPDFVSLQIETQKQTLADKLKALEGILTPEQLKIYEQKQLDMINMQANAMKMFMPKTTNGVAP